jgi:ubiquinone/menaquinone biosynthesis C-methylase UbiE
MSSDAVSGSGRQSIHPSTYVSYTKRDSRIQTLIDDSFQTRVLPLHQGMFDGRFVNYLYVGNVDYSFQRNDGSYPGVTALEMAEEFAASKEKFDVLDLGTGNGAFLISLKDKFKDKVSVMGVTAADFRPTHYGDGNLDDEQCAALKKSLGVDDGGIQEYLPSRKIKHQTIYTKIPDSEYVVGNIENLNQLPELQGRKFDLIVSAVTFRHLSDPLGVLCQAYELLKQNGVLICDEFELNGIAGLEYVQLFHDSGCTDVEILPESFDRPIHDTPEDLAIAFKKLGIRRSRQPFSYPIQTRIRKTVEHLIFPVAYDLQNSIKADPEQNQAQIFYTTGLGKILDHADDFYAS